MVRCLLAAVATIAGLPGAVLLIPEVTESAAPPYDRCHGTAFAAVLISGNASDGGTFMNYQPDDSRVRFWQDDDDPARSHLDVRELLQEGGEPYAIIMECVHGLQGGECLVLHAVMQPRPLLGQLGRMGYAHETRHVGADHWEIEIRPWSEAQQA